MVKFITECVKKIKVTLDGKNVEAVLTELGTRLHRVILDHLQQFQYSSIGLLLFCNFLLFIYQIFIQINLMRFFNFSGKSNSCVPKKKKNK